MCMFRNNHLDTIAAVSDGIEWNANYMNDGNVASHWHLFLIETQLLSADCPPAVTITPSDGPPYEAGDVLTCSADGFNPTYEWSGSNGGSSFSSTENTVTLQAGEFCLTCTATLNSDSDCSACQSLCEEAYSKYQKQHSSCWRQFMYGRWPIIALNAHFEDTPAAYIKPL